MNHYSVSILKSIIRIISYFLMLYSLGAAVIGLILAEALGILEEIVDKRKEN